MNKHPLSPQLTRLQIVAAVPGSPLPERISAARLVIEIREREGMPLETRPQWVRDGVRRAQTHRPWHVLLERLESFAA